MKSSSAPAPSICGLARMTTRSPLAIGVAISRDSSIRACMQPPRRATPRHMEVRRNAFMDQLPGRDAGCLWARQVCHVAASSLCDLGRRCVVPNLTWDQELTASDRATTEGEYVEGAEKDSSVTKNRGRCAPGGSRASCWRAGTADG